ncbi:hypothetical protein HDV00_007506 [Rhizophlyctis rosea]|nr:hypothetical protein HDV00_007506 [Rhizophlyctis rosea]
MSASGDSDDDLFGENSSDRDEQQPTTQARTSTSPQRSAIPPRRIADSSDEEDAADTPAKSVERGRSPQRRPDADPSPPRDPSPSRSPSPPRRQASRSRSQSVSSDDGIVRRKAAPARVGHDSDDEEDRRERTPIPQNDDNDMDLFGDDSDASDAGTAKRRQERNRSEALQGEDEVMEEAPPPEPVTEEVRLPPVPLPKPDSDLYYVRFPSDMQIDNMPFVPEKWQGDAPEKDPRWRAQDVIRWRKNPETQQPETNTHVIKWSDGTYTLRIGKEHYDFKSTNHLGYAFLALQYPRDAVIHHVARLQQDIRLTALTKRRRGRYVEKKESKAKFTPTFEDPLKRQKEIEKVQRDARKNDRQRASKQRALDRTRRLEKSDVEGGYSDDDRYERGNQEMSTRLETYHDEDDEGFVVSDEDEDDEEERRRGRLLAARKNERRESGAARDRERDREREREREREYERSKRERDREREEQERRDRERDREKKRRRDEESGEEGGRGGGGGGGRVESEDEERVQRQKKSRRVIVSDDDDE